MIIKLLQEIRPLNNHHKLYDSYTHAVHTMSIITQRTNLEPLIVAGLLHEVKAKLGSYKYERCIDIIKNSNEQGPKLASKVEEMLEQLTKPEDASIQDYATKIFTSSNNSDIEVVFLADVLSEVELTYSATVCESYNKLFNKLIDTNIVDLEDSYVISIRSALTKKLLLLRQPTLIS